MPTVFPTVGRISPTPVLFVRALRPTVGNALNINVGGSSQDRTGSGDWCAMCGVEGLSHKIILPI